MQAAMGASEDDVVECLRFHYNERGIRPGTKDYPRSFNWFPAIVAEHFRKHTDRVDNSAALGFGWEDRNETRVQNIIDQAAAFDVCSEKGNYAA